MYTITHPTAQSIMKLKKFGPDFHYNLNQVKRFGCMVYWSIDRKPETKFSPRAIRDVLVEYMPNGYLFLNPETEKFFKSEEMYVLIRNSFMGINTRKSLYNAGQCQMRKLI